MKGGKCIPDGAVRRDIYDYIAWSWNSGYPTRSVLYFMRKQTEGA